MGIVEFLTARLDEDEHGARYAADPGLPEYENRTAEWSEESSGILYTGDEYFSVRDSTITRFVEVHDPARVLREVTAKRAIVRLLSEAHDDEVGPGVYDGTMRALASIYTDHPDYRTDW